MVINKFGDQLYNGLEDTIVKHLQLIEKKVEAAQGESFLRELKLRWDHHNKSMQMIRDILMVKTAIMLAGFAVCLLCCCPTCSCCILFVRTALCCSTWIVYTSSTRTRCLYISLGLTSGVMWWCATSGSASAC